VSEITDGIPSGAPDILLDVHPEGYDKVKQDRGPQGQEGQVDEIHSDSGGGNTPFIAQVRTYTEYLPFDEIFKAVHTAI
jgi:hypothetical protein